MGPENATPVRTLLVSDLHLGCKHSQSTACLNFLRGFSPQQIYLVGDIVDGWKCNNGWHWPPACDEICELLRAWVDDGVTVYYVPGNHDSFLRQASYRKFLPRCFSKVSIADEFVYETLRGWRFLVTHGDLFDFFETRAQWISKGTSWSYDAVLSMNRWLSEKLTTGNSNPYAACAHVKGRVKRAVRFISRFEESIFDHATSRNCEGVICGHIHTPDIISDESRLYCNTGDWVENCTGLVEHLDGSIRLESAYESPRFLKLASHPRITNQATADRSCSLSDHVSA